MSEKDISDITNPHAAPALERLQASDPVEGARPMPKPARRAIYGPDGTMSREAMVEVIRNGGSVGVWRSVPVPGAENGETKQVHQIVWRVQDLPDELDLAGADPTKRAAAIKKMEARKAEIERRLAQAKAQAKPAGSAPEKPPEA